MSIVALVNPWETANSRKMNLGPAKGAKAVLIWFGLCIAMATVGTTLTSGIPEGRAQLMVAKAQ